MNNNNNNNEIRATAKQTRQNSFLTIFSGVQIRETLSDPLRLTNCPLLLVQLILITTDLSATSWPIKTNL